MAKIRIGDIIEFTTNIGLAYAQFTHMHKRYGNLLRVFEGAYGVRPVDFNQLTQTPLIFSCFFPLTAAIKLGIVSVVGHEDVPKPLQAFPIFRDGTMNPETKKVANWWLWDGEREWRVEALTAAQRKLPMLGIWNDTLIIERIESGWRPETDPR